MRALSIILAGLCLLNLGLLLRLRTLEQRAWRTLQDMRDLRIAAENSLIRYLERTIEESEPDDQERIRAIKFLNWIGTRKL